MNEIDAEAVYYRRDRISRWAADRKHHKPALGPLGDSLRDFA
jgi:hypothetical protein